MMKRHLARSQNDIHCFVCVLDAGDCVAPAENIFLLRFFPVRKGLRVRARQNTETAI